MQPGYIVDGTLNLNSGESRLAIEGSGGSQTDARVRIDVASLGDWLPAAGGRANGNFHIEGKWPQLDIDGDISGRELAWSGIRADSMELVTKVKNLEKPAGALTLKAENVSRGDIHFDTVLLEGDGNEASHQAESCRRRHTRQPACITQRRRANGRWQGRLKTLALDPVGRNLPDFSLDAPAGMDWDGQRFALSETCLSGKPGTRRRAPEPTPDSESETPAASNSAENNAESVEPDEPELPARLCIACEHATRWRTDRELPARAPAAAPARATRCPGFPGAPARRNQWQRRHRTLRRWPARGPRAPRFGQGRPVLQRRRQHSPCSVIPASRSRPYSKAHRAPRRVHAALDHDGLLDGTLRLTPAEGK